MEELIRFERELQRLSAIFGIGDIQHVSSGNLILGLSDSRIPQKIRDLRALGLIISKKFPSNELGEIYEFRKHLNALKDFSKYKNLGRGQIKTSLGELQVVFPLIKKRLSASSDLSKLNYFELMAIHREIREVSEKLFNDGHYASAILEAFKKVNILVKNKSGRTDLDGVTLMHTVFSKNTPILKFNSNSSESDKDEQEGFMHIFAGAILGIRNPKAHEIVEQKDPMRTLEYIVFASLLCKRLAETKKNISPK